MAESISWGRGECSSISHSPYHRPQERADAVPGDLHANAQQDERRQADDHVHGRISQHPRDGFGEAVAQVNADADQRRAHHRGLERRQAGSDVLRPVRADRDGERNRTRADG